MYFDAIRAPIERQTFVRVCGSYLSIMQANGLKWTLTGACVAVALVSGCASKREVVYVPAYENQPVGVLTPAAPGASVPVATAPATPAPSTVVVTQAPPPPQVEVVTLQPGPDYIWAPGYWVWNGRWVWVGGSWMMRPAPGRVWVGERWEHHPGRGWRASPGHWR